MALPVLAHFLGARISTFVLVLGRDVGYPTPRTDPYSEHYSIRLLPWVI